MNKKIILGTVVIGFGAAIIFIWQNKKQSVTNRAQKTYAAMVSVSLPDTLSSSAKLGQSLFEINCASCHGENAAGQDGVAPPLIHKIYEPSHHGDESFQSAVARGVSSHHWSFGDMPPIKGITRAEVSKIIIYVRELQRANQI